MARAAEQGPSHGPVQPSDVEEAGTLLRVVAGATIPGNGGRACGHLAAKRALCALLPAATFLFAVGGLFLAGLGRGYLAGTKSLDKLIVKAEQGDVSEAPLLEFYMYRAAADGALGQHPFGNINTANVDGVLWYLMNEVVTMYEAGPRCPRKFDISLIHRFKVRARATRELFGQGANFGARFAFDQGACKGRCFPGNLCTGERDCEEQYQKYGYVLGCNRFTDHYPFPDFDTSAPGGIWYSLPLEGRCDEPTGEPNCTWSYEDAGAISLESLEATTAGWGNCCNGRCTGFWDDAYNNWKTSWRVGMALDLFQAKYPTMPRELGGAPCDFHWWTWYGVDPWPRQDPWGPTTTGVAEVSSTSTTSPPTSTSTRARTSSSPAAPAPPPVVVPPPSAHALTRFQMRYLENFARKAGRGKGTDSHDVA